jgi:hypothetical protein
VVIVDGFTNVPFGGVHPLAPFVHHCREQSGDALSGNPATTKPIQSCAAPDLAASVEVRVVTNFKLPLLLVTSILVVLLGGVSGAEHEAGDPVVPVHVQFQGPVPVTAESVPTEQRLVVGALVVATPLAEPHAPTLSGVDVTTVKLSFPAESMVGFWIVIPVSGVTLQVVCPSAITGAAMNRNAIKTLFI